MIADMCVCCAARDTFVLMAKVPSHISRFASSVKKARRELQPTEGDDENRAGGFFSILCRTLTYAHLQHFSVD